MPKYRKRPIVIEAEQWWPNKPVAGVEYTFVYERTDLDGERLVRESPYVKTLEGEMFVSPGDWIITGVAGEKYPCKDHIFQATYEPVPEEAP